MNIIQIGCDNCEDEVFEFVSKNLDKINKFIVIDAMPKAIHIAKEKYASLGDRLIAINCAIGLINGITKIYFPIGSGGVSAHASLSREHVHKHLHPEVCYEYIPCLKINSILETINLEKIDHFFIDIEGFDVEVLLEMNFEKFAPENLVYEFYHSDGTFTVGEKNQSLLEKLHKLGYKFFRSGEYNIKACK